MGSMIITFNLEIHVERYFFYDHVHTKRRSFAVLQFVVAPLHTRPLKPKKRRQFFLLFLMFLFPVLRMLSIFAASTANLASAQVCAPLVGATGLLNPKPPKPTARTHTTGEHLTIHSTHPPTHQPTPPLVKTSLAEPKTITIRAQPANLGH